MRYLNLPNKVRGLFLIAAIVLIFTGCSPKEANFLDANGKPFSGSIFLTLERAVIVDAKKIPLVMELNCHSGVFDRDVFGYQFHIEIPTLKNAYLGKIKAISVSKDRLKLSVVMKTGFYQIKDISDSYTIELTRKADKLDGKYTATYRGLEPGSKQAKVFAQDLSRRLKLKLSQGQLDKLSQIVNEKVVSFFYNLPIARRKIQGKMNPFWPIPVKDFVPLKSGEHPRLVFRKQDIPALRRRAKTPEGEKIISILKKKLETEEINYGNYIQGNPNSGSHAAGWGLLYVITADEKYAQKAAQIVEKALEYPITGAKMIRVAPQAITIALAYDLCFEAWNKDLRVKVADYLSTKAQEIVDAHGYGYNPWPQSNWYAICRGGAGTAALAVYGDELSEKTPSDILKLIKIAEYSVRQYLTIGVGEHGFGSEGESYLFLSLDRGLLPFFYAYRTAQGKDFVNGSRTQWILPLFVMKMIYEDPKVSMPHYGSGGNFLRPWGQFAMGLGTASDKYKPAVYWMFNRYFGLKGDGKFDIFYPHNAIYALKDAPVDTQYPNPSQILPKVVCDEQKGYYVFRNKWQGRDDFVATIYLKKERLRASHSYPDAGSFRIYGLGAHWATVGRVLEMSGFYKQENENIVLIEGMVNKGSAKPLFFKPYTDGSGIVSMDISGVYKPLDDNAKRVKGIRSFAVDYSQKANTEGLFIVVDKISADEPKVWRMHTRGKIRLYKNTFTITSTNTKATLKGTFIAPSKVKLSVASDGTLEARGGNDFFVVMTVQSKKAPQLDIEGTGLNANVKINNRLISFEDDRIILQDL